MNIDANINIPDTNIKDARPYPDYIAALPRLKDIFPEVSFPDNVQSEKERSAALKQVSIDILNSRMPPYDTNASCVEQSDALKLQLKILWDIQMTQEGQSLLYDLSFNPSYTAPFTEPN